jgi:predicted RNA methylase
LYTGGVTAPQTKFPLEYVNKTVSLKYFGKQSDFHLSHGLFSSNDVDAGTRLLLKAVAARVDMPKLASVLDVGCGMGVIGISIARAAPQARVTLQDRDALAVAFARENARANGVQNADVSCGLAFWGLGERLFDLFAANLPAKAGKPVLESFFQTAPRMLSAHGVGAIVIVSPLEQLARDSIQSSGCLLFHAESTGRHAVFFFQRPDIISKAEEPRESLAPYLRTRQRFSCGELSYELETAYNLPDFDTLGYAVGLAQEMLPFGAIKGNALFWNPGQGHLPVYAETRRPRGFKTVRLAGRDALEVAIAERNLVSSGRGDVQSFLLATEAGLAETMEAESIDFFSALVRAVPKAPWHVDLVHAAEKVLVRGGMFLAAGESTEVFRVLDLCGSFTVLESRKKFGFRAVLLLRR